MQKRLFEGLDEAATQRKHGRRREKWSGRCEGKNCQRNWKWNGETGWHAKQQAVKAMLRFAVAKVYGRYILRLAFPSWFEEQENVGMTMPLPFIELGPIKPVAKSNGFTAANNRIAMPIN
ncbi:MAG: hypothetical protein V4568_00315 [Pseudomonadota bacterium]